VRKAHENAQPKTWKPNDGGGPTKTHKHRVLKVSLFFFFSFFFFFRAHAIEDELRKDQCCLAEEYAIENAISPMKKEI
jgi:hypothetical protein